MKDNKEVESPLRTELLEPLPEMLNVIAGGTSPIELGEQVAAFMLRHMFE